MKSIDKMVASKYPIRQTQCLWIDLSQDVPVMKVHTNGEWVAVGYSGSTENKVIEITYEDLKDLRDNGKLTPGQQYRITDYHCTTTQENTNSADHQFDIIVTADDEKTLNENARAINHVIENPEYLGFQMVEKESGEIVKFMRNPSADVFPEEYDHKHFYAFIADVGGDLYTQVEKVNAAIDIYAYDMGYLQIVIPKEGVEENYEVSELYQEDYFKDCNLAAWELKYCIDNDTNRFVWAKPHQDMVIENEGHYYRRCPSKDIDDEYAYAFVGCSSREPYNFIEDGEVIYTKSPIPKVDDLTFHIDAGDFGIVYDILREDGNEGNGVIYYMKDEWNNECPYDFKNIQFKRKLTDGDYDPENGTDTWVYTFNSWHKDDEECHDVSADLFYISEETRQAAIDDGDGADECDVCKNNVIKQYQISNDLGYFENRFALNDIVFLGNSYDDGLDDGYFVVHIYSNTFGNNCFSNTVGDNCFYITVGNECNNNTFGVSCFSITLGNKCCKNTIGNGCHAITIGNECHTNAFDTYCTSKNLEYTSNKTGIRGITPEFWFNGTKRF